MDLHPANHFLGKERGLGIRIELPTGNHVNILAPRGKVEGEIAEELTRCRVVGIKVPVDEDRFSHINRDAGQGRLDSFQVGNPCSRRSSSRIFSTIMYS